MHTTGLTTDAIATLRLRYGFNELPEKKQSYLLLFLKQFWNVMVAILASALLLSLLVPMIEGKGTTFEGIVDALVIGVILVLNALLGFFQEYKAEEAIAGLKKLSAPHSRVRRDGREQIIPSRELLPGDMVIVEAGDRIAADGTILVLSHLDVNESALTGESLPVQKQCESVSLDLPLAEQKHRLFAGTLVTRGSGEYRVDTIGLHTQIGLIAQLVQETHAPETPLQGRMRSLGKTIALVAGVLCVVVVSIGVWQGRSLLAMLLTGTSLMVSAVPEGLPAVITLCFAIGVKRMVRRHVIVRRLEALEALGSVTVICTDKTGTITENRMEVAEKWLLVDTEENNQLLLQIAASCNRAVLPDLGDPTELGLLRFAERQGISRLLIDDEQVPFTSEEKYMQTRHGERVFLKGAPEKIVSLCDPENASTILTKNTAMASRGLRVLGFATIEHGQPRFVGLIALHDPVRKGVPEAVLQARSAGIRTIMITGDTLETAVAVAMNAGITGRAITGNELDRLKPLELKEAVSATAIFARVAPLHKVQILDALKARGDIVAMSGDGVNDAPALKGAHVGIAMGKDGTQVAREAGSIVLTDDHFATIVRAIREGRRIYDNIRKFVLFLLRANFDELLFIATAIALDLPLPYLPLHILWINLMTDSLPALALSMEHAESDIMRRPPRDPREHLLDGEWGRLVFSAVFAFGVAFLLYLWQLKEGVDLVRARSLTLTFAILFELLQAVSTRSTRPITSIGFFTNPWMLGAIAIPFILHLILLTTPIAAIFHLAPLRLPEWALVSLLALASFALFECLKFIRYWRDPGK